jgi:hypothetical protein
MLSELALARDAESETFDAAATLAGDPVESLRDLPEWAAVATAPDSRQADPTKSHKKTRAERQSAINCRF